MQKITWLASLDLTRKQLMHDLALQASQVWKSTTRTASIIGQGASCEESTFLVSLSWFAGFFQLQHGTTGDTKHKACRLGFTYQISGTQVLKHKAYIETVNRHSITQSRRAKPSTHHATTPCRPHSSFSGDLKVFVSIPNPNWTLIGN